MKQIYLDWNIFNKIEKLTTLSAVEQQLYVNIQKLIVGGECVTPYSNAHMNDLYRGYQKDPSYAPAHIKGITALTNNLCIVQYWGESNARWHLRDPQEFLESTAEETDEVSSTFEGLFGDIDDPMVQSTWKLKKLIMRLKVLPENFRTIYSQNPIFNSMFPRAKIEMNMLTFCEDLYQFSIKIKSDYGLYKNYKKFLVECRVKFPAQQKLYNSVLKNLHTKPRQLTWDELWEQAKPKLDYLSNPAYNKIFNHFTMTDLKGYRQDERFANLIDDALHCFYAAHCDYFVTIDQRCYDKAKKVYSELKISTIVARPEELLRLI